MGWRDAHAMGNGPLPAIFVQHLARHRPPIPIAVSADRTAVVSGRLELIRRWNVMIGP
jgi:hypothetical protein